MTTDTLELPPKITVDDYHTLIGHAVYLRDVRGEHDMPRYFFDLAEKIGHLLGDPELVRCASAIRNKE